MICVNELLIKEINSKVTLKIMNGITYITGQNGTGKTFFLDYLCKIRKYPVNAITGNNNVIYMRQNFSFYNRLKVKEFINFIYDLCGEDKNNFYFFLEQNAFPFKIEKLENTKLGMLSGGERRAIYILAIFSLKREWYVLDEPFAFLDKEMKNIIIDIMRKLKKDNKNIIFTNHEYYDYMEEIVDHIIDFEKVKVPLSRFT